MDISQLQTQIDPTYTHQARARASNAPAQGGSQRSRSAAEASQETAFTAQTLGSTSASSTAVVRSGVRSSTPPRGSIVNIVV